jgi:hypothetical protein
MRGGKRPGAGRKKNVPNRASANREREAAASGATPLDVMLKSMRLLLALADESANDKKQFEHYIRAAAAVAKDVAHVHSSSTINGGAKHARQTGEDYRGSHRRIAGWIDTRKSGWHSI